jgi:hypothetical protein
MGEAMTSQPKRTDPWYVALGAWYCAPQSAKSK